VKSVIGVILSIYNTIQTLLYDQFWWFLKHGFGFLSYSLWVLHSLYHNRLRFIYLKNHFRANKYHLHHSPGPPQPWNKPLCLFSGFWLFSGRHHPQPWKRGVGLFSGFWPLSGRHHHAPNKCSFSGVVVIFLPPALPPPQNWASMVNFRWWWASPCSHHSLKQASLLDLGSGGHPVAPPLPPPQNWAFLLNFGWWWASPYSCSLLLPLPSPQKLSILARFWGWWFLLLLPPLQTWSWAFVLDFGWWWASSFSCHYHHPEIEHSCSISGWQASPCSHHSHHPHNQARMLNFCGGHPLALATTTTLKSSVCCSILGVVNDQTSCLNKSLFNSAINFGNQK